METVAWAGAYEVARKIRLVDRDKSIEGRFERLDEKVDRNSRKIDENGKRLDRVEAKLDTHDEYFVVLIKMMNDYSKKMDENQEEIRRLFGVKDEQHSSDLKGLGEGVRSNRERLDEHEGRLEDLEAS